MSMNSVIHFELPKIDSQRVSDFYSNAFGWTMVDAGPSMGNYIVATTTESDDKGPKKPGAINGGFFTKSEENNAPSIVISVPNLKDHMEKVTRAGGKLVGEPVDIPGVGLWISFTDTEGNRLSLLEQHK